MDVHSYFIRMYRMGATALILAILASVTIIKVSLANQYEPINDPVHLSWTSRLSRYDIVLSLEGPLKNVIKLDNVATSSLASALVNCTGYEACLIQDGKHVWSYKLQSTKSGKHLYRSTSEKSPATVAANDSLAKTNTTLKKCEKSSITLSHYCSTHWNPPIHLSEYGCNHAVEWHSPYSCQTNTTNYERPCFVYDLKGRLIDLTPWILSSGASYEVDTSKVSGSIKKFNLNICNEAHDACGPNVSACYIGAKGHVESGYNNLTSINYDSKDNTVILTTLGQHNNLCPDQRVKTNVIFVCKNKLVSKVKPQLIRTSPCENTIEWQTMHACPITETQAPATKCSINYQPLNITIDIKKLTNNREFLEVPGMMVDNKLKSMMFGFCQGISSKTLACEGKSTSTTSACLIESSLSYNQSSVSRSIESSEIVGTISKSFIRFADNRLYLESQPLNKSCSFTQGPKFNATRQVGTRIEFFCSPENQNKPTFLGFNECVYVFEWGSSLMCFEKFENETTKTSEVVSLPHSSDSVTNTTKKLSEKESKLDLEGDHQTPDQIHRETVVDAKKLLDGHTEPIDMTKTSPPLADKIDGNKDILSPIPKENNSSSTVYINGDKKQSNDHQAEKVSNLKQPSSNNRVDKLHKFLMICLIVMSLAGFVIIIFILDKKTKLRIPMGNITRQTRQAFQPQPVPYTRVDQFNDLDL